MGDLFHKAQSFRFNEISSTNSYASSLPSDTPEGSIVIANFQTQGRGQGNNTWESETGKNLTFSILLRPHFLKASSQFYISKVISLALADFLSLFVDNVYIKWPNDIYVGNRKIGGILIENAIEGQYISQSIVGIGLNINQKVYSSNTTNPISLSQVTNQEYDIEDILDTLKEIIEYRYRLLKDKEYKTIDENYTDFLYQFEKMAMYKTDKETFKGIIKGVESTGELIILDEKGVYRNFFNKEINFL